MSKYINYLFNRRETRFPASLEHSRVHKYNDIIDITFEQISPRATLCRIVSIGQLRVLNNAYGIAVRTKTDKEDPDIGNSLAFQRAIKNYLKKKKQQGK